MVTQIVDMIGKCTFLLFNLSPIMMLEIAIFFCSPFIENVLLSCEHQWGQKSSEDETCAENFSLSQRWFIELARVRRGKFNATLKMQLLSSLCCEIEKFRNWKCKGLKCGFFEGNFWIFFLNFEFKWLIFNNFSKFLKRWKNDNFFKQKWRKT